MPANWPDPRKQGPGKVTPAHKGQNEHTKGGTKGGKIKPIKGGKRSKKSSY